MKKILGLIKQNIFSLVCVLMAAAVFITGGISYSKYISSDPLSEETNVGGFTCVASIDGVSALSFTNTAFWGGSVEDDRIAMNALRSLEFTVSNHETVNGVQQINNVKTGYTLCFSVPQNFGEKLALQLFDEKSMAIMPQIVIEDIFKTKDSDTYNTATSEDYHADTFEDMSFVVNRSGAENAETITAKCEESGITVVLEPYVREVKQTLLFRLWDCSSLTTIENPTVDMECGTLCPPLEITYATSVPYYRVMISHSLFTMGAGMEETHKYNIRIAPTSEISDEHLGGSLTADNDCLKIDGDGSFHTISKKGSSTTIQIESIKYTVSEKDENGNSVDTEYVLSGAGEKFSLFETVQGKNGESVSKQKYYLSQCYSKNYPLTVNVIFEQLQN